MMTMDLSVVVVSWNVLPLLRDCLRSIPSSAGNREHEIVVADNASTDGSADMVRAEFPTARLISNPENLGFARANNQGIRVSRGRYVVLLNSDTLAPPGALESLVSFMDVHEDAGAVGPRLLRPDGSPQPFAFGRDPTLGYLLSRGVSRLISRRPLHDWTTGYVQEVDWVSGACLLARRSAIDAAGLLDERFFMYFEDNDWCLRFRQAGWRVYYDPLAEITHLGGQGLAQNPSAQKAYYRSLSYYYGKHYGPPARLLLAACLAPYRLFARLKG
jgi:N-acetylglucosaminyl-diphospho-decaprenol L-rhamnosyltransferase